MILLLCRSILLAIITVNQPYRLLGTIDGWKNRRYNGGLTPNLNATQRSTWNRFRGSIATSTFLIRDGRANGGRFMFTVTIVFCFFFRLGSVEIDDGQTCVKKVREHVHTRIPRRVIQSFVCGVMILDHWPWNHLPPTLRLVSSLHYLSPCGCVLYNIKLRTQSTLALFHWLIKRYNLKMSVVGVDLGYMNTVIAAAGRGGVDVLMNGSAKRLNP